MDNATYPQVMIQIQYYHLVAYYSEAWKEITELQLLGEVSSSLRTRLGCKNSLDGIEARLDHGCLKSYRQYTMWHGMIPWGLWWYTDWFILAATLALNSTRLLR